MFSKAFPSIPALIQLRQFSTASPVLPVVFKYAKNPKAPDSRFVIRQLLSSEIEEAADCIAEVYHNRENVIRTLKIPREQFKLRVAEELVEAQKHDLVIVCRDQKSNKMAGAIYSQDLRTLIDSQGLAKEEPTDERWIQYEDFYRACMLHIDQWAMPKGIGDILYSKRIAVDKEYSQLTLGNSLMHVARFLHPKMTKFNRNLIIATHEYTYNFCRLNGFELVKKIPYKAFRDRNNKKPFERMTKLEGRTELDDLVYVMKRENEGKSYFQEIKKVL